jgi:CrcB protein
MGLGIAIAGALGALARWAVDSAVGWRGHGFPWGIFVVNVTGALAIGALAGLAETRLAAHEQLRVVLGVGFLGAYTTFSTLSLDSYRLLEERAYGLLAANTLGSLAAGLAAVSIGLRVGRAL